MTFYIKGIYMTIKLTQYFELLYSIVIKKYNITIFLTIAQPYLMVKAELLEKLALYLPLEKLSVVLHLFMDSFIPCHIYFGPICI